MTALWKTAVSLRFFGDDLDPVLVSEMLGATPDLGGRKGEPRRGPPAQRRDFHTGTWLRRVERVSPGDIDAQVAELFAPLTTDLAVWRELSGRFRADLFCGLFLEEGNEGLSLSPETLVAIGARGLVMDLDIYGPGLG